MRFFALLLFFVITACNSNNQQTKDQEIKQGSRDSINKSLQLKDTTHSISEQKGDISNNISEEQK